ncbi:hypothetical protein MSAN_02244200 [Mycena sanguinolenta]|uniref:Uncharacterized protein n=1 Tax=Mycena sanguinolenta TaxID=230812 RepID=A0A8H7CIZ6_9AGAR|nr:hypothetical protein MSAN_02244200 [Mycena sanguinolenta]
MPPPPDVLPYPVVRPGRSTPAAAPPAPSKTRPLARTTSSGVFPAQNVALTAPTAQKRAEPSATSAGGPRQRRQQDEARASSSAVTLNNNKRKADAIELSDDEDEDALKPRRTKRQVAQRVVASDGEDEDIADALSLDLDIVMADVVESDIAPGNLVLAVRVCLLTRITGPARKVASGSQTAPKKERKEYEQKAVDQKRAQRADPAHKEALQAKRLQAAGEWDDSMVQVMVQNTRDLFRQRAAIEPLLLDCPPNAEQEKMRNTLKSIFDLACDSEAVQRAQTENRFWTIFDQFSVEALWFFLSLARGLTPADIDDAIAGGVLELSVPDDPTPMCGCVTYVRIAESDKKLDAVADYLIANPADAPYAIFRLAESGATTEVISQVLHEAFDAIGHPDVADRIMSGLNDIPTSKLVPDLCISTYSGTSNDKQPGDRHADDEKKASNKQCLTRLGNWLRANGSDGCVWRCFRIVPLCLPESAGIRTDRVASMCEQFAIALQALRGLNGSCGGFIRLFDPPSHIRDIITKIPPPNYGEQPTPASKIIQKYYRTERRYLRARNARSITDAAFLSAVKNGANALRSNGDTVPFVRLMKDVTVEDLMSEDKAFWQENAGKGPQLYRHLLRLLNSRIPEDGDISEADIASQVGPTFDFYRLTGGTPHFWLHALGTSALLTAIKPLIISTQSNAVFTAIAEGHLLHVWDGINHEMSTEILSGHLPADLANHLPSAHEDTMWHPSVPDHTYLNRVGQPFVGRYGRDECDLALVVPNLHPGVSKYRSKESRLSETIMTLVIAVDHVALAHVQKLHDTGVSVPRHDAAGLRQLLDQLCKAIEDELVERGIRAALDEAKSAYRLQMEVPRHIENVQRSVYLRTSPVSRAEAFEIPGLTNASARGDARLEQHLHIVNHVCNLISTGLTQRGFIFVPFQFRATFPCDGYRDWFLKLTPGSRISAAARVYGNTPEAHESALRSQNALATNTAAQSKGGQVTAIKQKAQAADRAAERRDPSTMLRLMVELTGNLITRPPKHRRAEPLGSLASAQTHRWGTCGVCQAMIVASDGNDTHLCTGEKVVRITDTNFPSCQRIVYPHDILADPKLAPLVPNWQETVTEIRITDLFRSASNQQIALDVLPDVDLSSLTGSIWVANDSVNTNVHQNAVLQVAMALDRCAESLSQCPMADRPADATERAKAWSGNVPQAMVSGKRAIFDFAPDHIRRFIYNKLVACNQPPPEKGKPRPGRSKAQTETPADAGPSTVSAPPKKSKKKKVAIADTATDTTNAGPSAGNPPKKGSKQKKVAD